MKKKLDIKTGLMLAITLVVIASAVIFGLNRSDMSQESAKAGYGAAILGAITSTASVQDVELLMHGAIREGKTQFEYLKEGLGDIDRKTYLDEASKLNYNTFSFLDNDSTIVVKKITRDKTLVIASYQVSEDLAGVSGGMTTPLMVLVLVGFLTILLVLTFVETEDKAEMNVFGKVRSMMTKIMNSAINIKSSSMDISSSTKQQGVIASEQSTSVAQITATMEELSATAKQIADSAESVLGHSSKSLDNVKQGSDAVDKVMSSMGEIKKDNEATLSEIVALGKKSKEITKVMEIINNIADQTKLIAFNAAIEASSAGEAGRRFGVVAVEIRRLADSVMESTSEIEVNISEIQESVDRLVISSGEGSKGIDGGLMNASNTVRILEDMLSGSQTTTDAAKQISLSTQQQNTASTQVVSALKEIAEGARQSSNAITQIGGVVSNLTQEAEKLENAVAEYNE